MEVRVTRPQPPRHVLASATEAGLILAALVRAGWRVREGFDADPDPDGAGPPMRARYGTVPDPATAERVVRVAAAGIGVVAVIDPDTPLGRTLRARLAGLPTPGDTPRLPVLLPEQRALLRRLAGGQTIAAAAAAEYLSLRTAHRRIASARAALGVATTRDAVREYRRLSDEPP
jgi:hypothetical protein